MSMTPDKIFDRIVLILKEKYGIVIREDRSTNFHSAGLSKTRNIHIRLFANALAFEARLEIKKRHPLHDFLFSVDTQIAPTHFKVDYKHIKPDTAETMAAKIAESFNQLNALLLTCQRHPVLMKKIELLEKSIAGFQTQLNRDCKKLI